MAANELLWGGHGQTHRTQENQNIPEGFEKIPQSSQKTSKGKDGRHKDCDEADSAAI